MTNLKIIKPPLRYIEINGQKFEIKFTLDSFAYLEQKFLTVENAIKEFNQKNEIALKEFLNASLIDCNIENYPASFTDEMLLSMASACSDALSKDYDLDTNFDWNLLYYIARPLLQFVLVQIN